MAWILLVIAGILEIGWAVGLKYTEGFTRLLPSLGTIAAMVGSMALLGFAVRTLPIGTAYAIWTGIGTVGTVLAGIFFAGRARDLLAVVLYFSDRGGHPRIKARRNALNRHTLTPVPTAIAPARSTASIIHMAQRCFLSSIARR